MKPNIFFVISLLIINITHVESQDFRIEDNFSFEKKIESTAVLNQYRSNTCWSYTVLGLLETEILNQRKENILLSEMYVVYYSYLEKAERYIRMHGKISFSGGGVLTDVFYIINKYGIVPNDVYTGLIGDNTLPDHIQLEQSLKNYLDELLIKKTIPFGWQKKIKEILDLYMGSPPTRFIYKNKEYTPKEFANELGIDDSKYIIFTSYMYKPYFQPILLEVPDNWLMFKVYNIPLTDLINVINNSIVNNYPVAITCDITETGFMWSKGLAYLISQPEQKEDISSAFLQNKIFPITEPEVTEQLRQWTFDTYETTDDHSLILLGIAKDKHGKKYYFAKNSWGKINTPFQGYLFLSENYIKLKTISVLVRKENTPNILLQKLKRDCN